MFVDRLMKQFCLEYYPDYVLITSDYPDDSLWYKFEKRDKLLRDRQFLILTYQKEQGILSMTNRGGMNKKIRMQFKEDLVAFLKKNGEEVFVKEGESFSPTGEKSQKIYRLAQMIPEEIRIWNDDHSWNKSSFRLRFDLKEPKIIAKNERSQLFIRDEEEVVSYMEKAQEEVDWITGKENDFIEKMRELDPYAFYEPKSKILCIGADQYSFSIKQSPPDKKRVYGVRFKHVEQTTSGLGGGYRNTQNLVFTMNNMAKEIRRNWLKTAMNSYPFDMIMKTILFAKEMRVWKEIRSDLPLDKINESLKKNFPNWEKRELTKEELKKYDAKKGWMVDSYIITENKTEFFIREAS